MTCLTTADYLTIRRWIFTELDDGELDDLAGDLDTTNALVVAHHLVRTKLSGMLARPISWSLSGDYAEQWHQNVSQLRKDADMLESLVNTDRPIPGAPVVAAAGSIVRADRERIGENY